MAKCVKRIVERMVKRPDAGRLKNNNGSLPGTLKRLFDKPVIVSR